MSSRSPSEHLGEPRDLVKAVDGVDLVEMEHTGEDAYAVESLA